MEDKKLVPCPYYTLIDEAHGDSYLMDDPPIEIMLHVLSSFHLVLKVSSDYSACVRSWIHGPLMSTINRLNNHGFHYPLEKSTLSTTSNVSVGKLSLAHGNG